MDREINRQLNHTGIIDHSFNGLINALDCVVTHKNNSGQVVPLGLTIHFSTKNHNWEIYYGRKPTLSNKVTGATLEEAVSKFVLFMNTPI